MAKQDDPLEICSRVCRAAVIGQNNQTGWKCILGKQTGHIIVAPMVLLARALSNVDTYISRHSSSVRIRRFPRHGMLFLNSCRESDNGDCLNNVKDHPKHSESILRCEPEHCSSRSVAKLTSTLVVTRFFQAIIQLYLSLLSIRLR